MKKPKMNLERAVAHRKVNERVQHLVQLVKTEQQIRLEMNDTITRLIEECTELLRIDMEYFDASAYEQKLTTN